jgi:hypothetical protein
MSGVVVSGVVVSGVGISGVEVVSNSGNSATTQKTRVPEFINLVPRVPNWVGNWVGNWGLG